MGGSLVAGCAGTELERGSNPVPRRLGAPWVRPFALMAAAQPLALDRAVYINPPERKTVPATLLSPVTGN